MAKSFRPAVASCERSAGQEACRQNLVREKYGMRFIGRQGESSENVRLRRYTADFGRIGEKMPMICGPALLPR
jgi:hypothetical protein